MVDSGGVPAMLNDESLKYASTGLDVPESALARIKTSANTHVWLCGICRFFTVAKLGLVVKSA